MFNININAHFFAKNGIYSKINQHHTIIVDWCYCETEILVSDIVSDVLLNLKSCISTGLGMGMTKELNKQIKNI